MANLAITTPTFNSNTIISSSEMNQNNSDITTYINNRNTAAADWEGCHVTTSARVPLQIDNSSGANNIANFQDNGSNVFVIADGGIITKATQPSFLATAPSNTINTTGDGTNHTVEFDTEIYDLNADFNTGTFEFTAPVTGKYLLTTDVRITGLTSAYTSGFVQITTSNRNYANYIHETELVLKTYAMSVIADMDANDTVTIVVNATGGGKTAEVSDSADVANFSGSLIN